VHLSARVHDPETLAGDPARVDNRKHRHESNKLLKRLRSQVGKAIAEFNLIEDGDRVMVCLSGGKDSYALLDILQNLQRAAPVSFELIPVHLDQKQPGYPPEVLPDYLDGLGLPYHILQQDTFSLVQTLTPEGKTTCPVCSRLRRGILYACARRIGATKIALGHHLDDVVETLFLNMFFAGRLKAMPPKLKSDDGQNVVIRPLFYCRERDLARWASHRRFPIIPCNLCGSQENLQRQVVKEMLQRWDRETPGRVRNIARSLSRVVPSHLSDVELFDFVGLNSDKELLPLLDVSAR
jgi:tRNA 2-thiocytidine biosynthesis protein TtcA